MKPTKAEIEKAIKELEEAMLDCFDADKSEVDAKLRKERAHKRLTMARDEVRALTFN